MTQLQEACKLTTCTPATVMLVDNHPIIRDGLREVLERSGEFKVIGQAGDGVTAVRVAQYLRPDVIIMEVVMPIKNGIDACIVSELTFKTPIPNTRPPTPGHTRNPARPRHEQPTNPRHDPTLKPLPALPRRPASNLPSKPPTTLHHLDVGAHSPSAHPCPTPSPHRPRPRHSTSARCRSAHQFRAPMHHPAQARYAIWRFPG